MDTKIKQVNENTYIDELMKEHPETIRILSKYGVYCYG